MMMPIENNDTLLLFFHDLDSNNDSNKYTTIKRRPKYCQTVDYRKNFNKVFDIYEALIQKNIVQYPRVVLAGEGLGGWFANHFAHKFNLRALLIDPCIYPNEVLANDIPQIKKLKLSFKTSNTEDMSVLIEDANDDSSIEVARRTLVNLPSSWEVEYLRAGLPRIQDDIWYHLTMLCDDPIIWIDDATLHGEDD